MAQSIVDLQSKNILPYYNGSNLSLFEDDWDTSVFDSQKNLFKVTAKNGLGQAIKKLIIGYANMDSAPLTYYNDPATFGGQTTPSTAWLSPAQDDSWEPRYQAAGTYQQTTQVPTQQAPLMTHVYCTSEAAGAVGIWRIERVIDDNNFVVYDPVGLLPVTFLGVGLFYLCENTFPATSIQIVAPNSVDINIYTADNAYNPVLIGPTNITMTANQFGIVEPFLAFANGAGGIAIVNR